MATKRASAKPPASATPSATSPILTGSLLVGAFGLGLWTLVARGRVSWPPTQLLSSLFTVAGCLALVGPILLATRKGRGEGGLGELLWMSGGLIVWVFDLAALAKGEWRGMSWTAPLGYQTMGLTILAVLVAGWRWRSASRDWSWTNVTGWLLGLFWVGMGLSTIAPAVQHLALAR